MAKLTRDAVQAMVCHHLPKKHRPRRKLKHLKRNVKQ